MADLGNPTNIGTPQFQRQKSEIIVRCAEEIETKLGELAHEVNAATAEVGASATAIGDVRREIQTLNAGLATANAASGSLNRRLYWLNFALAFIGAVGAAATVVQALVALRILPR